MRHILRLYLYLFFSILLAPTNIWAQNYPRLVINELMINPNNVASLPEFEYIEIFNNSNISINLSAYTLHINNNQNSLSSYTIAPNQFVILCSQESFDHFSRFGNAIALNRWFALSNTSSSIKLTKDNAIVDEVNYRDSWYNSSSKRNGGWSLERINPDLSCNLNINWSATISSTGGTPGKQNSIFDNDFYPTLLLDEYQITDNTVSLKFNIELSNLSNLKNSTFEIDHGIGHPNKIDMVKEYIVLTFNKSLNSQTLYQLKTADLHLCNFITPNQSFNIFQQKNINKNDIIINEILFNPREGGVDFVELYNNTPFPINIQNFRLGNRIITTDFLLLAPGTHLAITTNKNILIQHYPAAIADNIYQTIALPPYPNQQGNVILYSNQNELMDSIYYNSSQHTELIINAKGISLERASANSTVFSTASTLLGGATPGYQNSNFNLHNKTNKIFLHSTTFSPNDDGFEDTLQINYELTYANYVISIEIFNEKGILVKRLANQHHAGTKGTILWDGKDDNGRQCKTGHYIVHTKIFNIKGDKQHFKHPFVLIQAVKTL